MNASHIRAAFLAAAVSTVFAAAAAPAYAETVSYKADLKGSTEVRQTNKGHGLGGREL